MPSPHTPTNLTNFHLLIEKPRVYEKVKCGSKKASSSLSYSELAMINVRLLNSVINGKLFVESCKLLVLYSRVWRLYNESLQCPCIITGLGSGASTVCYCDPAPPCFASCAMTFVLLWNCWIFYHHTESALKHKYVYIKAKHIIKKVVSVSQGSVHLNSVFTTVIIYFGCKAVKITLYTFQCYVYVSTLISSTDMTAIILFLILW